jgi:phospholysine phosphohistidine inorganic pyrophosphate phosphatase
MSSGLSHLNGLLIDLEGTVYEAGRAIPGAREALAELGRRGVPHVFVTNTTSRPRRALVSELAAMGIDVKLERIFTAPVAAREYLKERGWLHCHLLVRPAVLEDLKGIEGDDVSPQAVVVGDIGEDFSYISLNRAFRLLLEGAELVTLARNRFYRAADGLVLDQGPFVAALEHASGKEAILVGKPAPMFYRAALSALGLPASEVAVIGDDLEAEVAGAHAAGMRGILVRTGKFREEELSRSEARPDAILDSLKGITTLL